MALDPEGIPTGAEREERLSARMVVFSSPEVSCEVLCL